MNSEVEAVTDHQPLAQQLAAAPRWRIRPLLAWLVLACLLPGMIGVTVFFFREYWAGRAQAEKDTIATARALIQVADSQLLNAKVTAIALASAGALARGDFPRFHQRARELLAETGVGANVVLSDESGQQLVNTLREAGEPLPRHGNPELLQRVFTTGQPVISDVYIGGVLHKPVVSIDVPVTIEGKLTYDLSIGLRSDSFDNILHAQNFPADWIVAILDSSGTIVARTHDPEKFVGKKGTAEFILRIREAPEGAMQSFTRDGTPSISHWSRSPVTGWSVAIGIPRAGLEQQLLRPLSLLAAGMLALLIGGLGMAWIVGRKVARSVQALNAPATALGNGETPSIPALEIKEVAEVAAAIGRAADLLQARTQALQEVNRSLLTRDADLREAHHLARFGDWQLNLKTGEIIVSDSVREIFGREIPSFPELQNTLLPTESWTRVHTAIHAVVRTGAGFDLELPAAHANGAPMWINMKGEAIRNADGGISGLLGTVMDISERKRAEAELETIRKTYRQHLEQQVTERTAELTAANQALEQLARKDALTGLPNRIAANERLRFAFLRLKRAGSPYAILFMDIDYFKSINDTYGHEIGDRVLQEFASVLKSAIRETDFVARFGGEEFLAVLSDTSIEGALTIAEKIRQTVAGQDFETIGQITVSLGVSSAQAADDNEDDAVRRADQALYQAKASGRNAVRASDASDA